jgi:hypothetical protein
LLASVVVLLHLPIHFLLPELHVPESNISLNPAMIQAAAVTETAGAFTGNPCRVSKAADRCT